MVELEQERINFIFFFRQPNAAQIKVERKETEEKELDNKQILNIISFFVFDKWYFVKILFRYLQQ